MCIEAEEYFDKNSIDYTLYLMTDEEYSTKVAEYKAYSSFNKEIGEEILSYIEK